MRPRNLFRIKNYYNKTEYCLKIHGWKKGSNLPIISCLEYLWKRKSSIYNNNI